jgi:hypothetical protein
LPKTPADAGLEDLQVDGDSARGERAADQATAELRDTVALDVLRPADRDARAGVQRRRRPRGVRVVAEVGAVGAVGEAQEARGVRGRREDEAAVGTGRHAAAIDVLRAEAILAHEDPDVAAADRWPSAPFRVPRMVAPLPYDMVSPAPALLTPTHALLA